MERIALTSSIQEIVTANNEGDDAVDCFSYEPTTQVAAPLGSIVILGRRTPDADATGYLVSLVAALARREYYAQSALAPKEAFTRTLRKVNDVVRECAPTDTEKLAIGVVAFTGSQLFATKLGSFKLLLARDGTVLDILNAASGFARERTEQKQFSHIISGVMQANDRVLAFVPNRGISSREKSLKSWLAKHTPEDFADEVAQASKKKPSLSATLVHVMIRETRVQSSIAPILEGTLASTNLESSPIHQHEARVSWAPRQQSGSPTPTMISTEYSFETRKGRFSHLIDRMKYLRLDTRGRAIMVGLVALVIIGGTVGVKKYALTSAEERTAQSAVTEASSLLDQAKLFVKDSPAQARKLALEALATITSDAISQHANTTSLNASIVQLIDSLDSAVETKLSLFIQPIQTNDKFIASTWSSASMSLWGILKASDGSLSVVSVKNHEFGEQIPLPEISPDIIMPWENGVAIIDTSATTITIAQSGTAVTHILPTQDHVRDAMLYAGSLYLLTDQSITKVSGISSAKPVGKLWLAAGQMLPSDAQKMWIDGSIHIISGDGTVTTLFKGAQTEQSKLPLEPTGAWSVAPNGDNRAVILSPSTERIYFITSNGVLERSLKLDSEQTFVSFSAGEQNNYFAIAQDGKIWQVTDTQ